MKKIINKVLMSLLFSLTIISYSNTEEVSNYIIEIVEESKAKSMFKNLLEYKIVNVKKINDEEYLINIEYEFANLDYYSDILSEKYSEEFQNKEEIINDFLENYPKYENKITIKNNYELQIIKFENEWFFEQSVNDFLEMLSLLN